MRRTEPFIIDSISSTVRAHFLLWLHGKITKHLHFEIRSKKNIHSVQVYSAQILYLILVISLILITNLTIFSRSHP